MCGISGFIFQQHWLYTTVLHISAKSQK